MLMEKQCTKCQQVKPIEQFYKTSKRKNGIHPWCKECVRFDAIRCYRNNPDPYRKRAAVSRRAMSAKLKAEAITIKEQSGCVACGERTLCVLDFHHTSGNSKGVKGGMPVSRAANVSIRKFRSEISKCVVLCANCHRKAHAGLIKLT